MELELPVPAQHQADDARAPRSGLVDPLAQRLEAAGALLSRLQFVASSAEVADVRALVDVVAGELMLLHASGSSVPPAQQCGRKGWPPRGWPTTSFQPTVRTLMQRSSHPWTALSRQSS